MATKKQYSILTLFLIIILCISLVKVQAVRADGEPPTEPPVPVQVETEAPVEPASNPVEPAPVEATSEPISEPTQDASTDQSASAPVVLPQGLGDTDIVVLDEQGQSLVLGSQDTANALVGSDPVWCPESTSAPTPGANGCSASYSTIADLLAAMQSDPQSFSQNGTIFLEKTEGLGF